MAKPKYLKGDILLVKWLDAKGCSTGWVEHEDLKDHNLEPFEVETVGFLVKMDRKVIVLAQDKGKESAKDKESLNGLSVIPAPWAQEIIKIDRGEPKDGL